MIYTNHTNVQLELTDSLLSHLQLSIHTNNAANQIPISVLPYPVTHHNSSTSIAWLPSSSIVLTTQVLNDRRVYFCCNPIWPTVCSPEIRSTQKVHEKWLLCRLCSGNTCISR